MYGNDRFIEVKTEDISPKLLKAIKFNGLDLPSGKKLGERYVYDYELEFYLKSKGAMVIDGKIINIKDGDIILRKPGQIVEGIMPYSCYFIILDLLGDTGKEPETYNFIENQSFQKAYRNKVIDTIPTKFTPNSKEKYYNLFDRIYSEFLNGSEISRLISKSLLLRLFYNIYNDINESIIPLSPHYSMIKRVLDYIKENYNRKITLHKLSQIAQLSPNYFHKIFKEVMRTTPNEYIIKLRLDKSKEKIINTSNTINKISQECGFDNFSYFCALFKRRFGVTPKEYRNNNRYIL